MNNKLVVYFSNTGNNKFLAEKLGKDLPADVVQLDAGKISWLGILWSVLFNAKANTKPLDIDWGKYNELYVCGPIWMGKMSSPIRYFLDKYGSKFEKVNLFFASGSDESKMVSKIIDEAEKLVGKKLNNSLFLPMEKMLPDDADKNPSNVMKLKLGKDSFLGKVKDRYNELISNIK